MEPELTSSRCPRAPLDESITPAALTADQNGGYLRAAANQGWSRNVARSLPCRATGSPNLNLYYFCRLQGARAFISAASVPAAARCGAGIVEIGASTEDDIGHRLDCAVDESELRPTC
jgi:hypothetical protein